MVNSCNSKEIWWMGNEEYLNFCSRFSDEMLVALFIWWRFVGTLMHSKYLRRVLVEDWIRKSSNLVSRVSNISKGLIGSYLVLGNWMMWKTRNGHNVKLRLDPWIGGGGNYLLSQELRNYFLDQGFYRIGDCGIPKDMCDGQQIWLLVETLCLSGILEE